MKKSPAEITKELKNLDSQIRMLQETEKNMSVFTATIADAEVVRPSYSYEDTAKQIQLLQDKVRQMKHVLNCFNVSKEVPGFDCTVDQLLVLIPQLSERKRVLREMSMRKVYDRAGGRYMSGSSEDYEIANYDIELAKKDYEVVSDLLSRAQMALDTINTESVIEFKE